MKKEYFKLNNIEYNIDNAEINMYNEENGIRLFIEVSASTNNSDVDFELRNIYLYHNNGFQTGVSTINELNGKKYSWSSYMNDNDEEAGTLYVLEHEDVTKATIEILDIFQDQIIIRWEGLANVFWGDEFGADVPFETEFIAKLPKTKKICINAYEKTEFKIDNNCKIKLINFEDIEFAANKMHETRQFKDFNTTLKFKVIYDDNEYLGRVIYTNGKNNYETIMDEKCPIIVKHCGFEWSTKLKEFNFMFEVSNQNMRKESDGSDDE